MRKLLIAFVALLMCFFTACGKKTKPDSAVTPTEATVTVTITEAPNSKSVSDRITWALPFSGVTPSAESQEKINSFLYENGYDCAIDFVQIGVATDEENEAWLLNYTAEHGSPDVINVGYWSTVPAVADYAEQYCLSLDEYLMTEEGKKLYDVFAPVDWAACAVRGNIYTIPWIISDKKYNRGVYLLVNEGYRDMFADFDGTYQFIHDIYCQLNDNSLAVVMADDGSLLSRYFLFACMGYQTYSGKMAYDPVRKCIVDFAEVEEQRKLSTAVDLIYTDLKNEVLLNPELYGEDISKSVLAYIRVGISTVPDGFYQIEMSPASYDSLLGGSVGIARDSKQKELALRIVTACYSNPEIATLLCPSVASPDAWKERRELMLSEQPSVLTGFLPVLSGMQKKAFNEYSNIFTYLESEGMFVYSVSNDSWSLRNNFRFEGWGSRGTLKREDIRTLVQELNTQLAEYIAAKE